MPLDRRLAGFLLHPTSLPGPFGIGDLGPQAYHFINWLHGAGLGYWQVLPLGPTGYGDSPYQCFSAFAGNPLLISPELLVNDGLLSREEATPPAFPEWKVDYGWVIPWKQQLLRKAHGRFARGGLVDIENRFRTFIDDPSVSVWLDDYALYMACKDANEGRCWCDWEPDLCARKPKALKKAREDCASDVEFYQFVQFLFFEQWGKLRQACHERHIEIIGDTPIYVAYDSSDTWANQHLFQLDKTGKPTFVAGVPPDYFSETGQLWGNPLYHWKKMARDGYAWWIQRLISTFRIVDILRIDHFRGFMGYYAIPFGSPTAQTGHWEKGPGAHFFEKVKGAIGALPIIAEDLGEITNDVPKVRDQFGLPGMKIMQFAWSTASEDPLIPEPGNTFLPHRHERNMVVYTGTHDNDTSVGWWHNSSKPNERRCMQHYLATDGNLANWDLIRAAFMSVANTAIFPAQDLLSLGSDARMNYPGNPNGNWSWRLSHGQLTQDLARQVREMTLLYDRCATPPEAALPPKPNLPLY